MPLVPRLLGRVVLLIAALLPAPSSAQAEGAEDSRTAKLSPWSWETTPAHRVIAEALRESRRQGASPARRLVDRMLAAGPGTLQAELDILVRRRVPEAGPKDAPQILSAPQRELLLAALARTPGHSVRAAITERLADAPGDVDTRLAAIHALGAIGEAGDVARILEIAPRAPTEGHPLTRDAREAVRSACTAILSRDPRAFAAISELTRRVDSDAARALLEAVGSKRDPRALAVLRRAAQAQPSLGPQVAALVVKCGVSTDPLIDRELAAWAMAELPKARPEYARSLLQALGVLDQGACVPAMIARLEDADPGVRDSALWALRRVSGLAFPGLPASWENWHHSESSWHHRQRPRLRDDLASIDPPRMILAMRAYAEHRTKRFELAGDVEKVLLDPRPELRRLACEVLGRLGSMSSCPALFTAVEDSDSEVSQAARTALRKITGLEPADDPALARGFFQSP